MYFSVQKNIQLKGAISDKSTTTLLNFLNTQVIENSCPVRIYDLRSQNNCGNRV